jgi:hypothetical protein
LSDKNSHENEEEHENKSPSLKASGVWRPVDPSIWRSDTDSTRGFLRQLRQTVVGAISSLPLLVVAIPALLLVPFSFILAYDLGGARFFGLALLGIWSLLITAVVVALEKTGYDRNYQSWDNPLRRIIAFPIAFLVALGLFYFIVFLGFKLP